MALGEYSDSDCAARIGYGDLVMVFTQAKETPVVRTGLAGVAAMFVGLDVTQQHIRGRIIIVAVALARKK
jgi:hypothetical protein